jgi:hypothetical protein
MERGYGFMQCSWPSSLGLPRIIEGMEERVLQIVQRGSMALFTISEEARGRVE